MQSMAHFLEKRLLAAGKHADVSWLWLFKSAEWALSSDATTTTAANPANSHPAA